MFKSFSLMSSLFEKDDSNNKESTSEELNENKPDNNEINDNNPSSSFTDAIDEVKVEVKIDKEIKLEDEETINKDNKVRIEVEGIDEEEDEEFDDLSNMTREQMKRYFLKGTINLNQILLTDEKDKEDEIINNQEVIQSDMDYDDNEDVEWKVVHVLDDEQSALKISIDEFLLRYYNLNAINGVKSSNIVLYLEKVKELYCLAKEQNYPLACLVKLRLNMINTLFDIHCKKDKTMNYDEWYEILEMIIDIFNTLDDNNIIISTKIIDDENFTDDNNPYRINDSLINIIRTIDDELTKIFYNTDIEKDKKLNGEKILFDLLKKVQNYVESHRLGNMFDVTETLIIYIIRIEHLYYKYDENNEEQKEESEKLMDKLCQLLNSFHAVKHDMLKNVIFPSLFNCVRHPSCYNSNDNESNESLSNDNCDKSQTVTECITTIDKKDWSFIKPGYMALANHYSPQIRHMIAQSLHEVASLLDEEIVDLDLVPLFTSFISDDSDIYQTALQNMSDFFRSLSKDMRLTLLHNLNSYLKVDGTRCWRLREEFADQCLKLCSLYSLEDINIGISCFALAFMDDKFDSVRQKGTMLLAQILSMFIVSEWPEELLNVEVENIDSDTILKQMPLTNGLLKDARRSFVNSMLWRRRQTWATLLRFLISYDYIKLTYFGILFGEDLKALAVDKIANNRIKFLTIWKELTSMDRDGLKFDEACPFLAHELIQIISNLANYDRDFQVKTEAKICLGLISPEKDELDYQSFYQQLEAHEDELWTRLNNYWEAKEKEDEQIMKQKESTNQELPSTSNYSYLDEDKKKIEMLSGMKNLLSSSIFLPNFQSLWHPIRNSSQNEKPKNKFEGSKFVVSSVPENERSPPTYKPVPFHDKPQLAEPEKSDSDDDELEIEPDDDVCISRHIEEEEEKGNSEDEVKNVVVESPDFVVDAGIVNGLDISSEKLPESYPETEA